MERKPGVLGISDNTLSVTVWIIVGGRVCSSRPVTLKGGRIMAKSIMVHNRLYKLFEASIRVDGIADTFWFGRPVEAVDAYRLASLIELGKRDKAKEVREVLGVRE